MLFHKRRPVTPIQFSMNNRIIDVVQYFNYLGIMLDVDMSWKTHVAMVRNKLSRINGILHRLDKIDKIQKKAVRTITYSNYIAHSEPLLKELNLLKVKDLFELNFFKFLFKLYHNNLPPYFNSYRSHLEKNCHSLYIASTSFTSSPRIACICGSWATLQFGCNKK